jgi:hypothetical protein
VPKGLAGCGAGGRRQPLLKCTRRNKEFSATAHGIARSLTGTVGEELVSLIGRVFLSCAQTPGTQFERKALGISLPAATLDLVSYCVGTSGEVGGKVAAIRDVR